MKFFPPYKDEGEVVAIFGQAQLIRYLDGKVALQGGNQRGSIGRQGMDLAILA
jgi:hypothetical protein